MTSWIIWRELIGGSYGFRGVYSNKRAVLQNLHLLAGTDVNPKVGYVLDINERVKVVDGEMNARVRARNYVKGESWIATIHDVTEPDVPHPDADEAVLARQEYDRIAAEIDRIHNRDSTTEFVSMEEYDKLRERQKELERHGLRLPGSLCHPNVDGGD